jgi:DNA (cytosine-5)-methyltransferase 1
MNAARAYYNEHDPHAAQWLRNLIDCGAIALGDVDERDIRDVVPNELAGYTQCHFFAGIGGWSYALRRAGWPDDRRVWTWSEPCQPFSAAGRRKGAADERYLRPYVHHLVRCCRPAVCFGEQVASKDGLSWLDVIQTDMEGEGYTFRAFDLCAAGVGSPHIRQRLFFVAGSGRERCEGEWLQLFAGEPRGAMLEASGGGCAGSVADSESIGLLGRQNDRDGGRRERASRQGREVGELGDTDKSRLEGRGLQGSERTGECAPRAPGAVDQPGPTNGFWRDADWLFCTDGKWRPVEPGSFPLVDGAAFRVGSGGPFAGKSRAKMLKGYGNAINAEVAAEFVAVAMEALRMKEPA